MKIPTAKLWPPGTEDQSETLKKTTAKKKSAQGQTPAAESIRRHKEIATR